MANHADTVLPTIRWCEVHDQPWEGLRRTVACVEGARVVLPVDFDERMKAQGMREEVRPAHSCADVCCRRYNSPAERRYVSDWIAVGSTQIERGER